MAFFAVHLFGTAGGAAFLIYAGTLSSEASPLVQTLQNSFLLSAHMFSAAIACGAFTVGSISSLLCLAQERGRLRSLPDIKTLERIGYHSVVIGFPFMTLVIILGALWADISWGKVLGLGSQRNGQPRHLAPVCRIPAYAQFKKLEGQKKRGAAPRRFCGPSSLPSSAIIRSAACIPTPRSRKRKIGMDIETQYTWGCILFTDCFRFFPELYF